MDFYAFLLIKFPRQLPVLQDSCNFFNPLVFLSHSQQVELRVK